MFYDIEKKFIKEIEFFSPKTEKEIIEYINFIHRHSYSEEKIFLAGMLYTLVLKEIERNNKLAISIFMYMTKFLESYNSKLFYIVLFNFLYFCHKNKIIEEQKILDTFKEIMLNKKLKSTFTKIESQYLNFYVNYFTEILAKNKNKEYFYDCLFSADYSLEIIAKLVKEYNSINSKTKQKILKILAKNYYKLELCEEIKLNENYLNVGIDLILGNLLNVEDKLRLVQSLMNYSNYINLFEIFKNKKFKKRLLTLITKKDIIGIFFGILFEIKPKSFFKKISLNSAEIEILIQLISHLPENLYNKAIETFYKIEIYKNVRLDPILLNNPFIIKRKDLIIDLIKAYINVESFFKKDAPNIELDEEVINSLNKEELLELIKRSICIGYNTTTREKFSFSEKAIELIKEKMFEYLFNEETKDLLTKFLKAYSDYFDKKE